MITISTALKHKTEASCVDSFNSTQNKFNSPTTIKSTWNTWNQSISTGLSKKQSISLNITTWTCSQMNNLNHTPTEIRRSTKLEPWLEFIHTTFFKMCITKGDSNIWRQMKLMMKRGSNTLISLELVCFIHILAKKTRISLSFKHQICWSRYEYTH